MFDLIPYSAARCHEWNTFVAQSKNGTFLFDRGYMDYHSDRFTDASLMCYLNGVLFALLPANRVGDTLYSHQGLTYGGLVMNEATTTAKVCHLFDELNAYWRSMGVSRVVYKPVPHIYHEVPAEEDLYASALKCKAVLVGRDVSSVIAFNHLLKWKRDRHYAANKAHTNGIEVRLTDDYATFWHILTDNLVEKFGTHPVHSLDEMLLLKSRFPDNIQLWTAFSAEEQMLAGTVLYLFRDVVRAQYISASPSGKRLHAVDGLYNTLIHHVFSDFRLFDLGTSNMPHSSDLHDSLIYQKEGFGARAVCFDTYEWQL